MAKTIFTPAEVQQLRADTKGTKEKIHFNNAGASLPPDIVTRTIVDFLTEEAVTGGYEMEARYSHQLENVYNLAARLINAQKEEIALVESASAAWHIAFHSIGFQEGDEIITSEFEYVTNILGLLNMKQTKGIVIKMVPNDEQGNFSLAALEAAISPKTRLIAITHIPSTAGGMLPIEAIGNIARQHKILYLVDACQSIGQVPIDVAAIQCDLLSVTGRKFLRAPRGTGFLYVRKEIQDQLQPIFIDGHSIQSVNEEKYQLLSDARRFELYEYNRGVRLGLGAAIQYALDLGVEKIWQQIQHLASYLREQLQKNKDITLHDSGDHQCGIITFSIRGVDSVTVKDQLLAHHINVSVGRTHSTLYYMNRHHLEHVVRASVHYYNTETEIDQFCATLQKLFPIT